MENVDLKNEFYLKPNSYYLKKSNKNHIYDKQIEYMITKIIEVKSNT